jgi:hypothetical protein
VFHVMGEDNVEKHWFTCEAIFSMKRIIEKASNIMQLETTFKDRTLTWYMKYKVTRIVG